MSRTGIDCRYGRQLREAVLRATVTELAVVEAVHSAYCSGDLSVFEASERLRLMLRSQHDREQQAA